MIVVKSVRRIAVLTTVAAACAAPVASANVADAPIHQDTRQDMGAWASGQRYSALAEHYGQTAQSVPPRVDAMGSRPSGSRPISTTVVPLVQPTADSGFDWTSAAIGAAALLSLALLGTAGWLTLRGRRTTALHRSRPAS